MSKKNILKKIVAETKPKIIILDMKFNDRFYASFAKKTQLEKLEFFAGLEIIHNQSLCSNGHTMGLVKKTKVIDGYVWFCSICRKERTCRYDSLFESAKIPMISIFRTIQLFCRNSLQNDTVYEVGVSKNTVSHYFQLIRESMQDFLLRNPLTLGGIDDNGHNKVVEIDESLFFKRKYNRGRIRSQQWVLGMVARDSKAFAFKILPNRRADTIIPIIVDMVLPNTTILTDCWAAYNKLSDYPEFDHMTVNHSLNFLNPDDSAVHTQTIESCWGHAKRKLKNQNGTSEDKLEGYLYEFAYKRFFPKDKCFNNVLLLLQERLQNPE